MSSAHELAQTVRADMPDWPSTQGGRAALAELERLAADTERYRQALERLANPTDEPRSEDAALYQIEVEQIARAALEHASPLANGGTG